MRWFTGGRRRVVMLFLCVAAMILPQHATAAAPVPTLGEHVTIRAARSAYTSVTIPKDVDFRADGAREVATPSVRFTGQAFGWLLEAEPAGIRSGFVGHIRMPRAEGGSVIFRMDGKNRRTGQNLFDTRVLPAGRYRLHVFTSGPGSVRFRLPGLRGSIALDARKSSGVTTFTEVVETVQGVAAPPAHAQGATFENDKGMLLLAFDWVHTVAQAAAQYGTCTYQGDPPAGRWIPGCPGGSTTIIGFYGVTTGCCGTGFSGGWFAAGRWSYGRWYDAVGVVDRAGIFMVRIPRR